MRLHYITYELALRKVRGSQSLRVGSAFHAAKEAVDLGRDPNEAISNAGLDQYDFQTVQKLSEGHTRYWENDQLECVAAESQFLDPIVNPETGKKSRSWMVAGKMDRVVRLGDGRLALQEYKTTSEDVSPGSDYWVRLRLDQQITLYFLRAREQGYDVQTILYDVTRKPTIKPHQVPHLDEEGVKVVLDADGLRVRTADGKKWRQSGNAEHGYTLLTRPETPEEWGERLGADIAERPAFYFTRQEIPRLRDDLEIFKQELWWQQLVLREAQRTGRWYRNPESCITRFGACPALHICHRTDLGYQVPDGFVRLDTMHPELDSITTTAPTVQSVTQE